MKKSIIYALVLICTLALGSNAYAQKQQAVGAYVFGVAYNPEDSTTFMTDIQQVPTAQIEKSGQMKGASEYSRMFADYLALNGKAIKPIAAVFYAADRNKAEKRFVKIRRHHTRHLAAHIQPVSVADFSFTTYAASVAADDAAEGIDN